MSWDIFVQDLPRDARTVDDIPEDFKPRSIGRRFDIIEKIKQIVPLADFSDPSWGRIEAKGFSIEVNVGNSEEVLGFAFHVRGAEEAAGIVSEIISHLGLRALDSGTGDLFDHERAIEGFKCWRAYRDQILKSADPGFGR